MEGSRRGESKLINIIRFVLALPVAFILFYIVGEVLLFIANWSYVIEFNKFFVFSIIAIKNIILTVSLYIIIPKFKKSIIAIVGVIMIILSVMTAYIYIMNGTISLASIYIMQIIVWIGIIIFMYIKVPHK